jgi:hypothetical protein
MNREKRFELLLKARNLLHKQENGQKLTGNEIIIAHDYIDMVIDDMVQEQSEELPYTIQGKPGIVSFYQE